MMATEYFKCDDVAAARIFDGGCFPGWSVEALYSDGQLAYHWNQMETREAALAKLSNPIPITKEQYEYLTTYRK